MSMGKRKRVPATELWAPTTDLPVAPSHPFYRRLNEVLRAGEFDACVEHKLPEILRRSDGPFEPAARRAFSTPAPRLL
jgi:hypothetical protein